MIPQPLGEYAPMINSLQAIWPRAWAYSLWSVVPLVAAISIVYKGTRVDKIRELPKAATKLALQILVVMTLAGFGLYALVWSVHRWGG